ADASDGLKLAGEGLDRRGEGRRLIAINPAQTRKCGVQGAASGDDADLEPHRTASSTIHIEACTPRPSGSVKSERVNDWVITLSPAAADHRGSSTSALPS